MQTFPFTGRRTLDISDGAGATYSLPGECANCGDLSYVRIAVGKRRPPYGVTCPRCGCPTVHVAPKVYR